MVLIKKLIDPFLKDTREPIHYSETSGSSILPLDSW